MGRYAAARCTPVCWPRRSTGCNRFWASRRTNSLERVGCLDLLRLATQADTRVVFSPQLQSALGLHGSSGNTLVCARRAVIPSAKPKFFTGRADANMYRQYAYMIAGLAGDGIKAHPGYPPRMVTVLAADASTTAGTPQGLHNGHVANLADMLDAVKATDVDWNVVFHMCHRIL